MSLYRKPETQKAYAYVLGLRYYFKDAVTDGEYILSRPIYNELISKIALLKNIISKIALVLKTFIISIATSVGTLNVKLKCL